MAAFLARGRAGKCLQVLLRVTASQPGFSSCARNSGGAALLLPKEATRGIQTSAIIFKEDATQATKDAPKDAAARAAEVVPFFEEDKDHFIPLTRRSIIRHLMQHKYSLTEEEIKNFEHFATALDSAIVNRHHSLLEELKSLFDPINPDKDTIATRKWNRRERLDNEFWLLQKLASVMEKANFHELPRAAIEEMLETHQTKERILISVDIEKYDVLRFWALGKEVPEVKLTFTQRLLNTILRRSPPKPQEYYKRVVAAVRLKRDDKLLLKAFKEVPVNALTKLLPDGHVKMARLDRGIFATLAGIAGVSITAKLVCILAHVHADWMMIVTGVSGLAAIQSWTSYKNRHLSYVNDLTRMLYFKNIANNRGLLTLLVDRAEDELFKEALLTYTFLLTNRPPSTVGKPSAEQEPEELGSLSAVYLEKRIEEYVHEKTGQRIKFDSSEAIRILKELGIMSEDYNSHLHVLSLDAAMRNLPLTAQSLVARFEEYDVVEGYDRSIYDEKESEYKEEEKKRRKYGWF